MADGVHLKHRETVSLSQSLTVSQTAACQMSPLPLSLQRCHGCASLPVDIYTHRAVVRAHHFRPDERILHPAGAAR